MDAPLPLDSTLGAALIGCFVAAALHGVTTLQTFIYYTTYPRDRLGLKLMVCLVSSFRQPSNLTPLLRLLRYGASLNQDLTLEKEANPKPLVSQDA